MVWMWMGSSMVHHARLAYCRQRRWLQWVTGACSVWAHVLSCGARMGCWAWVGQAVLPSSLAACRERCMQRVGHGDWPVGCQVQQGLLEPSLCLAMGCMPFFTCCPVA